MKIKILGLVVVICMLAAFTPWVCAATVVGSGTCGEYDYENEVYDDVRWVLDSNGVLTISGTGGIAYWNTYNAPWGDYKEKIKKVVVENGVTKIGRASFYECVNLTDLDISGSVKVIEEEAFYECNSLENVVLKEGLQTIGSFAFSGCDNLVNIEIPSTVEIIERNPFEACEKLENINVNDNNSLFSSDNGILFDKDKTTVIRYPVAKKDVEYKIPNGVTEIGNSAFNYCVHLKSVIIPESVQEIGNSAFSYCMGITNITIPNGVVTVRDRAFQGCFYLETITIPNSVTTLADEAIFDCHRLVSVTVDEGNLQYSSSDGVLFDKNRTKVIRYPASKVDESYTIPETVTDIADSSFASSKFLKEVVLPDKLSIIGSWSFSECDNLESINIPFRVVSIGDYAFHGCGGIKSITVDELNMQYCSIDGVLFNKDKTKLIQYTTGKADEEYKIPAGVNEIDGFMTANNLKNIVIPISVTKIDGNCFWYCENLGDVYYEGTESQWNELYIGYGNSWLTNATIHYNAIGSEPPTINGGIVYNNGDGTCYFKTDILNVQYVSYIIGALYNNGVLVGMNIQPLTVGERSVAFTVNTSDVPTTAKLFIWSNPENICPLCEAKSLSIE